MPQPSFILLPASEVVLFCGSILEYLNVFSKYTNTQQFLPVSRIDLMIWISSLILD